MLLSIPLFNSLYFQIVWCTCICTYKLKNLATTIRTFLQEVGNIRNYDSPHAQHRAKQFHEYNENSMQPYSPALWRELSISVVWVPQDARLILVNPERINKLHYTIDKKNGSGFR